MVFFPFWVHIRILRTSRFSFAHRSLVYDIWAAQLFPNTLYTLNEAWSKSSAECRRTVGAIAIAGFCNSSWAHMLIAHSPQSYLSRRNRCLCKMFFVRGDSRINAKVKRLDELFKHFENICIAISTALMKCCISLPTKVLSSQRKKKSSPTLPKSSFFFSIRPKIAKREKHIYQ